MNEEDTSLYGKNREGKVALCETLPMTVTVETRYDIIDVETI